MKLRKFSLVLASIFLVVSASAQDAQQMNEKGSALTKLTAHVDGSVIFGTGRSTSDEALFEKAFEDNPALKPLLGSHALRLQRGEKGIVLLVCTPDASTALLEDLSCTPEMDGRHWQSEPSRSCEFTLNASTCQ
jgi:hypothetical protein